MSDEDDVLAIVAALELLQDREQAQPPRSRWKASGRDYEASLDERTTWKNS